LAAFCKTRRPRIPIAVRATTFFESTNFRLDGAAPQRINLPEKSSIVGLYQGYLIAPCKRRGAAIRKAR
jgi:hypothetical protein